MKKLFVLFFALIFGMTSFAQETPKMSVTSFEQIQSDNTANLSGTMVRDQNGDPCALIRVQTTQTGFAWDFGQMQPVKVEQKTGEIWIYVPYGVKRVTIRHPKYESISYDFPVSIQKARTYSMRLSATGFTIIMDQEVTHQWVIFKLKPQDAMVVLDEQPLETKYGQAKKFVPFGEHSYRVFSKNYVPQTGTVAVDDPDNAETIEINLEANFAKVSLNALEGAEIYANGERLGVAPWTGNLAFDTYSLEIKKSSHRSAYSNLEFTRESPLSIELPSPTPIYGSLNIDSDPPATIILDGVPQGQTPKFISKVLIGSHEISLATTGFDESKQTVSVEEGKTETISAELVRKTAPATAAPNTATSKSGGYEYVDLGLSVKWATCNVGANRPEECGGYYQWAGTEDVSDTGMNLLDWEKCPYHNGSNEKNGWRKYNNKSSYGTVDHKMVLDSSDDVAHIKLGGKWRIPTDAEWTELRENCTWTSTTRNGINGYLVTSRKTGYTDKSIFLPAAGCRYGSILYHVGSYGSYWSSSLTMNTPCKAYCVDFEIGNYYHNTERDRNEGDSIRPVLK